MTALQARLARCSETGCTRKGDHEFHADGNGRTWAYREGEGWRPAWMRNARAKELAR